MKILKKSAIVMAYVVIFSSGAYTVQSYAYNTQAEHVADIINQSSELTVSGKNLEQRKLTDISNIQKIADIYRNAKKTKINDVSNAKFDIELNFPNNVTIKLSADKKNGKYIGVCYIGDRKEYFSTEENIYEGVYDIVKNTNQYIETYKEGDIIREGDYALTSVGISKATFSKSDNIILTGPNGTPDTLTSAPLSGFLKAPILITDSNKLRGEVRDEIKRLGAKNIYITSGTNVVNNSVRETLKKYGYNIIDLSSKDRYHTAENVARYILEHNDETYSVDKTILINGKNYADAPSISAFAYRENTPILLTNGKVLRKETFDIIKNKQNLLVVGGTNSVPTAMLNKLNDNYIKVGRLSGNNRYETSEKIVNGLFNNNNKLLISDGKNDLVAGIISAGYCVENNRPLLMVSKADRYNKELKNKNLIYLTKQAYNDINMK